LVILPTALDRGDRVMNWRKREEGLGWTGPGRECENRLHVKIETTNIEEDVRGLRNEDWCNHVKVVLPPKQRKAGREAEKETIGAPGGSVMGGNENRKLAGKHFSVAGYSGRLLSSARREDRGGGSNTSRDTWDVTSCDKRTSEDDSRKELWGSRR